MQYRSLKISLAALMIVSLKSLSFAVGSGGYENQVPHARAMGRANSVVASIDDASAVTFNPSRLTAVQGGDISLGVTRQQLKTKFSGSGVSDSSVADASYSPNFHVAHRFGLEKWGFGLGINIPQGLATEWSKTGVIAPLATESSLAATDINPGFAYKIGEALSLGLGLDYYMVKAESKLFYASVPAEVILKGDGNDLGGNIGLSYVLNEKHMLGLSYHTGSNVEVDGTLKITGSPDVNVKTEIMIPAVLQLGYAYKPTEQLTLELDGQWDKWSTFDNQEIKNKGTGQPAVPTTEKDWRNRWGIGFGTEYALKPNFFLRGGYAFWSTPIPNKTFEPSTPDSDTHMLTLGAGTIFQNNITLDFAAQLFWLNDRHIDNPTVTPLGANGTYKSTAQYFGLNVGYKFGAPKA